MRMIIGMEYEVNIEGDRANANEIFLAVRDEIKKSGEKMAVAILEGYQEVLVEILCSKRGMVKKKGLGSHDMKGKEGHKCRSRTFKRAGNWSDVKRLSGEMFAVEFIPAMVECSKCGKRLTPIIEGLELDFYQGKTELLLRKVMESVAERLTGGEVSSLIGLEKCLWQRARPTGGWRTLNCRLVKEEESRFWERTGLDLRGVGESEERCEWCLKCGREGD